jgi:two-component system sensor histidine kinase KdpD
MAVTKRGALRVLLGAAPGVGKTYAMLSEGRRLVEEGKDVVIALLETHGRKATQNAAKGLETVPRRCMKYRGMWFNEMDLFALIARRPQVALVDELAHTNVPGCTHEKRWQDVVDLLDAGIDVITTINVQHIESLNDVVRSITNSEQRETVPDKVLRSADSIELIDLPPKNLRERLSAGLIYSADRVDAALSNYFRVGNLTALRELALLWLAGNVDEALQEYRNEHHINAKWEARERVVVALSGGPEGEQLLRRGARVARASGGGDLIAVHVTAEDGLHGSSPGLLVQQRELVEKLGGTYHQIVGEDISDALISFARANNATQIIVGVSRRPPLARWLGRPSSANGIIANSGDIDVHVVTHTFAAKGMRLPRMKRTLTMRRRIAGCIFSLLSVPLLGWLLMQYSGVDALSRDSLFFQLLVVIAALIGGVSSATLCALLSGLMLDYVYIQPVGSLHMLRAQDVMTIVLYILIGIIVSFVVDRADEKARQAQRATTESGVLASVSDAVLRSSNPLQAILDRTREAFGFTCVRLTHDGVDVAVSGVCPTGEEPDVIDLDAVITPPSDGADQNGVSHDGQTSASRDAASSGTPRKTEPIRLELYGSEIDAAGLRLLQAIVSQVQTVLERDVLQRKADEVKPLAAAEKLRTDLLNAVSHDLRRPLASATAAVSGLKQVGDALGPEGRRELLDVADVGLHDLTRLVTDLLDVSRLHERAMPISLVAADVAEAVMQTLDELHAGPNAINLDLPVDLPLAVADPPLLRRAIHNVLANAQRYNPPDHRIRIAVSTFRSVVQIRVVDYGPGVPDDRKDELFAPFHRLGDTDNTTGLGLGMALSKGFIESMGGAIDAEDTPGGGLTMVITLRAADERYAIGEPLSEEDARACATALDADMWDVTAAASGVMLPLSVDESRDGELGRFADAESDTAVAGDMAAADEHTDVADVTAAEKEE